MDGSTRAQMDLLPSWQRKLQTMMTKAGVTNRLIGMQAEFEGRRSHAHIREPSPYTLNKGKGPAFLISTSQGLCSPNWEVELGPFQH